MSRLQYIFIGVFCLLGSWCHGQADVKGRVLDPHGQPASEVQVVLQNTNYSTTTDLAGKYLFENVAPGTYELIIFLYGYEKESYTVEVNNETVKLNCKLEQLSHTMGEFEINGNNREVRPMSFLKSIEGTSVYASRKTEVISLQKVNANLSTNNSRQIFAKVAGLNIWESDAAGLQLGIGGRGLSPNRTSNFNVRQNGYDISADALGYPESYYTPASEAIERVEVVRGAASLQYGTQFGGLLNFVMKKGPEDRPIQVTARNTLGSFGLTNSFTSLGGTVGRLNYYGFYQRKSGDGWRPNSEFEQDMAYGNFRFYLTEKMRIGGEFTHMNYLAHQAGGLTDVQFLQDPQQSNRDRNWFAVNWNLAAITFDWDIGDQTKFNLRAFGLNADRKALGFLGQITRIDPLTERDLIYGEFNNYGAEARLLNWYKVGEKLSVLLVGTRYYQGKTISKQGDANDGDGPDFYFLNPTNLEGSDFAFPSRNTAVFAENVIYLNEHFSITPGVRYEFIRTASDGYYKIRNFDLAGNVIFDQNITDEQLRERDFLLAGVGASYKSENGLEVYTNFAQNYRAINFNDIRIVNPNLAIDPNIQDESGFNADVGARAQWGRKLTFDASVFYLQYKDRIGEYFTSVDDEFGIARVVRFRSNIADARNVGVELFAETDLVALFISDSSKHGLSIFTNIAHIDAKYTSSDEPAFDGKLVELVPRFTFKGGASYEYKQFAITYQYSYTGEHFTDATNAVRTSYAVDGLIPSYAVMDLSASYQYKFARLEAGANNLADVRYFTRRASGYPGPGIIPAEARNFYVTLQLQF